MAAFPQWPHRVVEDFNRADQNPIASPWLSLVGEAAATALVSKTMRSAPTDDFWQARNERFVLTPPFEVIARYSAYAFTGTGGVLDNGAGTLVTRTGYTWAINDAGGGLMDAALRHENGDGSSSTMASNAVSPLPTSGDQIGCEVLTNGDIGVYVEYTPGTWVRILTANEFPLTYTSGYFAFGGFGVGTQVDRVTIGVPTLLSVDRSKFPKTMMRRPIGT